MNVETVRAARHERGSLAMDDDARWQAVYDRDRRGDGHFVFAVRTTGVYCRPSCASRRPRREHVRFFATAGDAERAGFRPCKRCRPQDAVAPAVAVARRVCRYVEEHPDGDLSLAALGEHVGLSPAHLQRVFKEVVGVTPRQYVAARRADRVKDKLRGGDSVTAALYDAGYGSGSQFYEHAPARLGMAPTTYQKGGAGMEVAYTTTSTPLGELLVAATARGVCSIRFGESAGELERAIARELPAAALRRDDAALRPWLDAVVAYLEGRQGAPELPLDVRATAFQARVWQALRAIPYGSTRSYGEVAEAIGQPAVTRAVAQACASNPVPLVIPCHRVVHKGGDLGGYRWGAERKRALLEREAQAAVRTAELPLEGEVDGEGSPKGSAVPVR